jgi:hypothetical protein
MLEFLHDRTEASYLVTDLATRIVEEDSDVITKLRYIHRTVSYANDSVAIEDAQQLRTLMLSPDTAHYFEGADYNPHDDSSHAASARNTERHLSAVMSYVAASGLVFAHSLLEFVLETLLRMTRLCEIEPWLGFVSGKTISISAFIEFGIEPNLETKLDDYIATLQKEGLLSKIDLLSKLLKRSITNSSVLNYTYDPVRLKTLDLLRHELAHHRKKDYGIDSAEADTTYLYRTAFHFLALVVDRIDLHGAHRPKLGTGV